MLTKRGDLRKKEKNSEGGARREGGGPRGRGGKRRAMGQASKRQHVHVIGQREGVEQWLDKGAEGIATCSSKAMRRRRPIESTG
jgi:hypothetical protein